MQIITFDWAGARLVFEWLVAAGGYGYQLAVRDGERWRPVSAPGNPLARGRSFDLFPQQIERAADGALAVRGERQAAGLDGAAIRYAWTGRLTPDPGTGWLHVDLALDLPAPLALQMAGGYEPEVTVDLGPLPPYERGDHVWFKTSITNPTKWNDEAYGNDFPGTYYYDPYLRLELLMFFDMTAMSWMGFDNIARFLNYRCGFRRRYRPTPAAEVGLYADGYSGACFPGGCQRIAYWLAVGFRDDGQAAPTEQAALATLVRRCLDLVPPPSPWPDRATSWHDFSLNCARDMANEPHAWRRDAEGNAFILNYVDGASPAWDQVAQARGRVTSNLRPCFESALWAAYPLAALCRIAPAPEYRDLQARLLAFMARLLRTGESGLLGGRPNRAAMAGTWQYVYFLEELWQVSLWQGDTETQGRILEEVAEVLAPLAQGFGYLFPLCFDKHTLTKAGNGDNHAVGGLYVWFMLALYDATAEARYLEEARQALRVLHNLPVNTVSQEAFLTSCGVQAADRLYNLTGEPEYATIYRYLLSQALRLVYWYSDHTSPEASQVSILGMVHACTPIIYAALFENIDTLARLTPTFKTFPPHPGILRLFDHARRNNFYCFPRCLPENWHTSPLDYIPHENIPLLEGPNSTPVGQEIYGAGFTFRAYLLWEALAWCEDRDVMVLNLDSYEERGRLAEPEPAWTFLVFNPGADIRRARLHFPVAAGRPARVAYGPELPLGAASIPLHDGVLEVDLQPAEVLYIRLVQVISPFCNVSLPA